MRDKMLRGRAAGGGNWGGGESHPSSKLSLAQVEEIRSRSNGVPQRALAEEYRVSQSAVSKVLRRETWK